MDLKWNVFYHNVNSGKIEEFNIFDHGGFALAVKNILRNPLLTDQELSRQIDRALRRYFWGRGEWEVVISDWPGGECRKKVDVYSAVTMNFDEFMNMIRKANDQLHRRRTDLPPLKKGRRTTYDERVRIAKECHCSTAEHKYGAIAAKYNVSYQQVRNWTRKYEQLGEAGLIDKRGIYKPAKTKSTNTQTE